MYKTLRLELVVISFESCLQRLKNVFLIQKLRTLLPIFFFNSYNAALKQFEQQLSKVPDVNTKSEIIIKKKHAFQIQKVQVHALECIRNSSAALARVLAHALGQGERLHNSGDCQCYYITYNRSTTRVTIC